MGSELLQGSRRRLHWVGGLLWLMALILAMQLVRWTIWPQTAGAEQAFIWKPKERGADSYSVRGNILDRDGHLLVGTDYYWQVSAAPNWIANSREAAKLAAKLAPYLNMSEEKLTEALASKQPYQFLGTVDYQTGLYLKQLMTRSAREANGQSEDEPLAWDAIHLKPIPARIYPEGSLAAHVLGFVNAEPKAFYGVEKYYDQELRGQVPLDLIKLGVPVSELGSRFEQNASPDGMHDLILTIDRATQYVVEETLRDIIEQYRALEGTIMVMDPKTGEVLASASYPSYEPGRYASFAEEVWDDPAVSEQYEPGSIFKVITMAAGLNAGVIQPTTTYMDYGCIEIGGELICNMDQRSYGLVDMRDVLLYSLNVGSTFVSQKLGPEHFYAYLDRFGFGQRTGIDLAGEVPGQVRKPSDPKWHPSDLGTNSYGQGLAVTPIQMITAISAVANKGFLMKPHVVRGIMANGYAMWIEPQVVRQVIREEAAATLTEMLVEAVDKGAELAQVPGYSVAGKSGTAEIPDERGYKTQDTIAGYVGYLPASDPAFVILVKIVRPQGERMGSKVAAPAFSRIARHLVVMAGIPPDRDMSSER